MTEDRKQESDSLSRARFGDTNDISARHYCRNGLSLNRSRCSVVEPFDDVEAAVMRVSEGFVALGKGCLHASG